MTRSEGLRVALAVEGTRGDVHPLLALGRSLLEAGHRPFLCGPPDAEADARACGIPFRPVGIDVRAFLTREAAMMRSTPWQMMRRANAHFREMLPLHFRNLMEATEDADVVVAAGTMLAAASIAERRGIPYRYVVYCPGLLPSEAHGPATLPWHALPPTANRLLWGGMRALMRLGMGGPIRRERAALGLPAAGDPIRYLLGDAPTLAADAELAPLPPEWGIAQIPSLLPFEDAALPPKLERFLESAEPPHYIGFGSATDPDPGATTRLVLEAVEQAGVRAILSEGWAGLGDAPLPEHVMVVGAVPHAALFRRVAAVVHHGGAGTTTTAARAGVPQVVVPHVLDQFYWAERVRRMSLGLSTTARRLLTRSELADALRAVAGNEWLAARASELGKRLRARLDDEESAAEAILGTDLLSGGSPTP